VSGAFGSGAQGELSVLATVSGFVCAVPASGVLRLAEAQEVPVKASKRTHPALLGTIELDGTFAAWDLSRLFGLPPDQGPGAWMGLSIDRDGRSLRIALRAGRCLAVRPLALASPLPPPLFRARQEAIAGTFVIPAPDDAQASLGLMLRPASLLNDPELAISLAVLQERAA
jgi:hypothetical protein